MILPGIYAKIGMPIYIFWPLLVIAVGNGMYWSMSLRKVKCPNCEKPILNLLMAVPKKCPYCHAKLKS